MDRDKGFRYPEELQDEGAPAPRRPLAPLIALAVVGAYWVGMLVDALVRLVL